MVAGVSFGMVGCSSATVGSVVAPELLNEERSGMERAISFTAGILLATVVALTSCVHPAKAAEVVYVQERVGGWFDPAIRTAIPLVDRYTSSTMKLVRSCPRTADRCIRFERKRMYRYHGLTVHYQDDLDSAMIYLNPSYSATYPMKARVTLVAHELGHAMGLGHGSKGSVMYAPAPDLGLTPRTFTRDEKEFLKWR